MQTHKINGIEMAVSEQGQGTPLLLVHGFPLSHQMWQAQLDSLAGTCRVIAPDLRGFGQTPITGTVVTMEQYADDLNALLDQMGVNEPVVLCGLSMGGYIALAFWRNYADRVSKIVFCNTKAAADTQEAAQGRLATADRIEKEGTDKLVSDMLEKLLSPKTHAARPDLVRAARQLMASNQASGMAAALRGMAKRPDSTELLATIKVPTLLIAGQDDVITPPAGMQAMAKSLPRAEMLEFADAGHLTPMEQPKKVNAALLRFLSAH